MRACGGAYTIEGNRVMSVVRKSPRILLLLAMAAGSATASLAAQQEDPSQDQQQEAPEGNVMTTVYGTLPSPEEMTKGPEIEGIISARGDGRMQVDRKSTRLNSSP